MSQALTDLSLISTWRTCPGTKTSFMLSSLWAVQVSSWLWYAKQGLWPYWEAHAPWKSWWLGWHQPSATSFASSLYPLPACHELHLTMLVSTSLTYKRSECMHQMQLCAAFHPVYAMQMQHKRELVTLMVARMYIMLVNIAKLSKSSHVADVTFKLLAASNNMKNSTAL